MKTDMMLKARQKTAESRWGVGLYLLNGPLTMEQILAEHARNPFASTRPPETAGHSRRQGHRTERLRDNLAELVSAGWVAQNGDTFSLTPAGREGVVSRAEQAQSDLKMVSRQLRQLVEPETASKVTLGVQIALALIKLPAGLLSGSIGLLNDSADTILDLLSSLLVYLGLRFNRERLVSILLVVFMLCTGSFTLFEAVQRLWAPYVPKVDWFSFGAALLSAAAGLGLWTYQRYVGRAHGLMAFITESVDSRNHVFVAIGVTAGLAASALHFGLLDMLVGLAVAMLILWSAVELVVDLVHSTSAGQPDLSRYGFWLNDLYEEARDRYLRHSLLRLVGQEAFRTRAELLEYVRQAGDYSGDPWLRAVGLDRQWLTEAAIERSLNEIVARGWVTGTDRLTLSEAGRNRLQKHSRYGTAVASRQLGRRLQ